MRRRTRNALLALGTVIVLLIALGAVPGLLKSGDPYYVTAAVEGDWPGALGDDATAIDASVLADPRYPYATAAIADATAAGPGRSGPYWRGPIGIKEAFTHSPFDEMAALEGRNRSAVADDGVYVHENDTVYRLAIRREDT